MSEPEVWTAEHAAAWIAVPRAGDDKYSRGVLGVRTGSTHYPGAAVLGVEAAWRTGLGMVRYLGPEAVGARVLDVRPETVLGEGRVQAWLVGSGMDASHRTQAETTAITALLHGAVPAVVDAGALDLVVASASNGQGRGRQDAAGAATADGTGNARLVLTPHDREFARLQQALGPSNELDTSASDLPARIDATRALAETLGHVVLRKGATTIIAAPGGWCATVQAGTPWLATAGTGDVLGGVIGALLAQNAARSPLSHDALAALAASGAFLHGLAGRIAAGQPFAQPGDTPREEVTSRGRPITALDVAHALPAAVASIISASSATSTAVRRP